MRKKKIRRLVRREAPRWMEAGITTAEQSAAMAGLCERKASSHVKARLPLIGAALMLTAQTFHISAQPALLLLVWSVGVIVTTVATGAKVGVHLAMALTYVWDLLAGSALFLVSGAMAMGGGCIPAGGARRCARFVSA
jgi:uncharacterized membrane protein